MDPAVLRYQKTHEWTHFEDGVAIVGITDFAVNQLTDLVYVDLPPVGKKLAAGETFGEVESVKAVSDLYAPVSGEVIEVNTKLEDDLAVMSDDPFGAGWLIKLKTEDRSEFDKLLDKAAYEQYCASEAD